MVAELKICSDFARPRPPVVLGKMRRDVFSQEGDSNKPSNLKSYIILIDNLFALVTLYLFSPASGERWAHHNKILGKYYLRISD